MDDTNAQNDERELTRHEEDVAGVSKSWRGAGSVRARKRVRTVRERRTVPREHEEVRLDRVPAAENDSGKVETLPDGSISIPVYEEQLVVTKRLVLKERVIVSKETVTERERVTATLRKERVEVVGDRGIEVDDERGDGVRADALSAPASSETRPFWLTSEFLLLAVVVAALVVAAAATSLRWAVVLPIAVGLVAAYLLSRGFSKAHSPSESWDPRERIGSRRSRRGVRDG